MFETLQFPPDARILEVGFGHGQFASWASRQVPKGMVLGVDIDSNMLDFAQKEYPASDYPNLEFRLADAQTLDFEAEPFDYAMSNACLHYLDHPGMAFAAIARHLKPGGRMCVTCLGLGNLRELHRTLEKVMQDRRWSSHFLGQAKALKLADGASCDPWLQKAGLRKKQARLFNETVHFPNRGGFQEWLNMSFSNYFEMLPELWRSAFSDEVVATYCRRLAPADSVRAFRVWLQLDAVKEG